MNVYVCIYMYVYIYICSSHGFIWHVSYAYVSPSDGTETNGEVVIAQEEWEFSGEPQHGRDCSQKS